MTNTSVPSGWTVASLKDLIEHNFTGQSPTCEERQIGSDEEWGLLKTTAVTWDGWNETAHKVPPAEYWGNTSIEVNPGDVLITKAGPRDRVGVVVHVRETRPHLMVSGKMVGLRSKQEALLPPILAGLLSTSSVQDYLNSRTSGMAESQTNFADEALLGTRLIVPPMSEQLRIADIIHTLENAILMCQQTISKWKLTQSALLESEFAGLKEAVRGEAVVPLRAVLAHLMDFRGRTPKKLGLEWGGGEVLALSANNVQMGLIDKSKEAYLGSDQLYRTWMTHGSAERGDVLITLEAPLGNVAQVPDDERYILSQRVVLLRFDKARVLNDFAYWALRSDDFQRNLVQKSTGTTASGIRRAELERLSFPIPSVREQRAIVDELAATQSMIEAEVHRLSKLRSLRVGMIADLLTGRVRVPEENAS